MPSNQVSLGDELERDNFLFFEITNDINEKVRYIFEYRPVSGFILIRI